MMPIESADSSVSRKEEEPRGCCRAVPVKDASHRDRPRQDRHGEGAHHGHQGHAPAASLNRTTFMATVHCLTGCAIGEVLGMVIGTALGWSNWPTVALAVALAFAFGYAFTLWPLRRAGMPWGTALGLAFASDTVSIAVMETVDNAVMVIIPGAMAAGLGEPLFWISLVASLLLAGAAAFPVNRWLIGKGKGHALVHARHGCEG